MTDKITDENIIGLILEAIRDIKGFDIKVYDLRGLESIPVPYFVICSGKTNIQVNALASSIEKKVSKECKQKPFHVEGKNNSFWILLDYGTIVVHIFQPETREFYDLEGMWGDAKLIIDEA